MGTPPLESSPVYLLILNTYVLLHLLAVDFV